MLKPCTCTLAAIAVIFSMAAYGADPAAKQGESQPAAETKQSARGQQIADNPGTYLKAAAQADNMGYVYAVVYNPTDVALANVYVIVVHFNAETRQPDNQSVPLLVAASLPPGQRGRIKLEGLQVYKPAELKLYRVIVEKAELAK